jgi:ankyrin repeat protein
MNKALILIVMLFHLALFATLPSDTDIIDAVNDGNLDRAKAMLERIPKLAEERSERDATPLHIAARKGYAAIAAALLEAGADPDPRDLEGDTPLHWAAFEGRSDIVELLLDRGAPVNARNARQFTPLHYAVMKGNMGVIRTLIGRGADIDARNVHGETPYDRAVSSGEQAIARYLASQRALTSELDLPLQN